MESEIPHIAFEYPERYSDTSLQKEIQFIESLGYKVDIRKKELEPMAGIEWALPTAFVVYLLKPYFEAFLQEAGKDHYNIVKEKLIAYIAEKKRIKVHTVTASKSPNKISSIYDQSRSISIKSIVYSNVRIIVLFNEELMEDELPSIIDSVMDTLLILSNEFAKLAEKANKKGKPMNNVSDELYLIMNTKENKWELFTQRQMFEKYNTSKTS